MEPSLFLLFPATETNLHLSVFLSDSFRIPNKKVRKPFKIISLVSIIVTGIEILLSSNAYLFI
jgi:hypothetical protein